MSNFHVGQKVVCIRHAEDLEQHVPGTIVPQFNEVYTIREIITDPDDGEAFFLLQEIVNEPRFYSDGYGEECWHHAGFRPVVERKTSIEVFRAMLNPSKQTVEA